MQTGIKSSDKLLLLALADRADENHQTWPGADRLIADTGLNRKTITAGIGRLSVAGLLTVQKRFGTSSVYTLVGVTGRETSTENGHTKNGLQPEIGHTVFTETSTKNGPSMSPKTVKKPKREPKEPKRKIGPKDVPREIEITDSMRDWFAQNEIAGTPEQHAEELIDYCNSNGKRYSDYEAAWRTRCRNSKKFAAERGEANRKLTPAQRVEAAYQKQFPKYREL